jgi:hypothetical protein
MRQRRRIARGKRANRPCLARRTHGKFIRNFEVNAQEDKETRPVFAMIGKNHTGFGKVGSSFRDFGAVAAAAQSRVLDLNAQKRIGKPEVADPSISNGAKNSQSFH